jgi:hypothetical protein
MYHVWQNKKYISNSDLKTSQKVRRLLSLWFITSQQLPNKEVEKPKLQAPLLYPGEYFALTDVMQSKSILSAG